MQKQYHPAIVVSRLPQELCWSGGLVRFFLFLICAFSCIPLFAQTSDSFESDGPRWRLVESDCDANITEHEISPLMPRSGRACELVEISCTSGQQALMAYPLEPVAVLNEFQPSIWIRCASGNIRLGVRVVFPNAVHPVTKSVLSTVIWGDSYMQSGNWQRLQIARIEDLVQQEALAIKQQSEQTPNLEQPMIDCLVLNVYTGPGRYRVQIDELVLTGMIPLSSVGVPLAANWRENWRWSERREPQLASSRFPVWLQHRGEEPAWLGSLGFNGLWLTDVPTPDQLGLIAEARLAAFSPPPVHGIEYQQPQLSTVQGWIVGVALNREQMGAAREIAAQAEKLPEAMRRPLVGEALEQHWLYSRMLSQTIIPSPDPASAGELRGKRAWLANTIQSVRLRNDGWVSLSAYPSNSINQQCRIAEESLSGPTAGRRQVSMDAHRPANPLGFRNDVVGAVMGGATGILVRTNTPLPDPISLPTSGDRAIQAAMRWCNNELKLCSPWLVWGQSMPDPNVDHPDFTARRWRVRNSDLIIVQNVAPESQLCLPATRNQPLTIRVSEASEVPQAIRLTENAIQPMTMRSEGGIQEWQVDRPAPIEFFLLTRNPQIIAYVRGAIEAKAAENAADQLEIASYSVEQATQLFDARFELSENTSVQAFHQVRATQQRRLAVIQDRLENGWRALQSRQPQAATAVAFEIIDLTQQIMHEAFQEANRNLVAPQSSPFVLNPSTLKYHWLVADACARSQWQLVQIPGSQFSDLADMLESGWTQQRRLQDTADLRVELVPGSSDTSRIGQASSESETFSLRLAASARSSSSSKLDSQSLSLPGGYEGASLRIRSAGFPVQRGQFVRITAQAIIRHVGKEPGSGLLVYDNQSGPSLGQLVTGKAGQRVPIELYRFATGNGDFRVLAECRGECDIQIADLAANIIQPATKRRSFVTTPLNEEGSPVYSEVPSNQ